MVKNQVFAIICRLKLFWAEEKPFFGRYLVKSLKTVPTKDTKKSNLCKLYFLESYPLFKEKTLTTKARSQKNFGPKKIGNQKKIWSSNLFYRSWSEARHSRSVQVKKNCPKNGTEFNLSIECISLSSFFLVQKNNRFSWKK